MNDQIYGEDWLVIGLLLLAAIVMGGVFLVLNRIIAPSRPNATKAMPFESGVPEVNPPRPHFTPRYYVVAMLFVVFDIEAIFIYPWAIIFDDLGTYGFVAMVLFILLLLDGYIYAWKKGALEWA